MSINKPSAGPWGPVDFSPANGEGIHESLERSNFWGVRMSTNEGGGEGNDFALTGKGTFSPEKPFGGLDDKGTWTRGKRGAKRTLRADRGEGETSSPEREVTFRSEAGREKYRNGEYFLTSRIVGSPQDEDGGKFVDLEVALRSRGRTKNIR